MRIDVHRNVDTWDLSISADGNLPGASATLNESQAVKVALELIRAIEGLEVAVEHLEEFRAPFKIEGEGGTLSVLTSGSGATIAIDDEDVYLSSVQIEALKMYLGGQL